MIALPLKIQDHYFEFLALIVDILDEYDFIIGLEAAIQLEAVYHMTSHIVEIQERSVPLFSNKDIKILPGTSTSIQLSGDLPCTFTSGIAIIRVQPVELGFSFNTIEVEFWIKQLVFIFLTDLINQFIFTKTFQLHILILDL